MNSEWKELFWGDIATLEYGKSLRDYKDKEGPYPVYGTNGLIGSNDEPLCNHPGVIIGRKGVYRGVHYSNKPFYVIDTAFYLKPKIKDLDLLFAYFELLTHNINSMDSGSAIPSTSREDFYNLPLRLPPIGEQKAISKFLNLFNQKINLNHQMNQILEKIGQAIFRHWFVHFEFPDENGQPYKSSGGEMVDSELGEIPAGWEVQELGNFIKFVKGKKPKEVFEIRKNGFLPQILIENLNGKEPFFANTDKMVITQIDDPIMVMDGASSGRIEIGHKGILGSTLSIIKLKNNLLSNYYVYYYLLLRERDINENTTGTSIPHTDKERINKYLVCIPKKPILDKFNKISNQIISRTILNKAENKNLSQIRDSLLPKLMSGKIRVPMGATGK